jgi:ubiquinone/menaquinone biosynthesis C-methylase UbiE
MKDDLLQRAGIAVGQRVLDVGFGDAEELIILASLVGRDGHVIGLERDPLRISQAKSWLASTAEGQRISLLQGAAEQISLPNECVDCVLCKGVLHEVRNIKAALSEMTRVLKPSGTLVLIDFQRFSRIKFELYRVLSFVQQGRSCGDLHPGFRPEELKELFAACNLEVVGEESAGMGRLGPYHIELFLLKGRKPGR